MRKQTEHELEERRVRIIDAASKIFFRYGFARATIGDIASEAKLARPAVYALYDDKAALFEASLERLVTTEIASYRTSLARFRTTRSKLVYCIERWSLGGFRMTQTHPDARDAFDMAYPAVRRMYEILAGFYAELLLEVVDRSALRIPALQLAKLLIFSLRGIKDLAHDEDALRTLLHQEVDIFLTAIAR